MRFRQYFPIVALIMCSSSIFKAEAQEVPYHISNTNVYEFLEELGSLKAIQLNNATLPLSRKRIATLLDTSSVDNSRLNKRQLQELAFYRQEFIKESEGYRDLDFLGKGLRSGKVFPLRERQKRLDLFFYKDNHFSVTVNPIVGGEGFVSGSNLYYQRVVGARMFGSVTKHLAFYGELRDYSESFQFSSENFLNDELGANYKKNNEFSEARGGIIANYKWISIGLVKDHLQWGSSYNGSNILSGRTPSVPMIKLHIEPNEWFSFDYVHAWLVSDVIDSSATYVAGNASREIMRSKFFAANMYTVRPMKGLHISLGNSTVYADRFNPVYLIPFLFYKSADHTFNSTGSGNNYRGQNSQMFLNVVSRQLKYLQLYTSWFIDEVRLSTLTNPRESRNHWSWKLGTRLTSPSNINLSVIFEYTRTNPIAFRHFISTTTYESNSYGLGHYLGDNAEEIFISLLYKPIARLNLKASFVYIRKGPSYSYESGSDGAGLPFIIEDRVKRYDAFVRASYSIAHDVNVSIQYRFLMEYGPDAYQFLPRVFERNGPHHFSLGVTIGY